MNDDQIIKKNIQNEIRDLAEIIGLLSTKHKGDPLLDKAQRIFLSLSVHVSKALNIQLQ